MEVSAAFLEGLKMLNDEIKKGTNINNKLML